MSNKSLRIFFKNCIIKHVMILKDVVCLIDGEKPEWKILFLQKNTGPYGSVCARHAKTLGCHNNIWPTA